MNKLLYLGIPFALIGLGFGAILSAVLTLFPENWFPRCCGSSPEPIECVVVAEIIGMIQSTIAAAMIFSGIGFGWYLLWVPSVAVFILMVIQIGIEG
jgi:hypothetical protein